MEFRSKLEDLMPAEELVFPASPGFGPYKSIMPPESIAHPAKFNVYLVEFLIDKHTKPGDVVLDPMAGTGILGVIAALRGRNAIQVELEPKFYEWMEKAKQNVENTPTLGTKGKIINILGDARRLSELLRQVDAIVTSLPYGNTYLGGGDPAKRAERLIKAGHDPREFLGGIARNAVLRHYNEIYAVITSPPYAETISHKSGGPVGVKEVGVSTITAMTYSTNEENIGNLPLGNIDVIITSPPYESSLEGTSRHTRGGIPSRDPALAQTGTYSTSNPDNIGNLRSKDEEYKMLDHVDERPERKGTLWEYTKEVLVTPENVTQIQGSKRLDRGRGETYVEAMMKVYSEMYKVLKPNGYAIVVIKPFIRKKQVVDLPYYTWLMMEKVGFKLEKLYKFRLPTKSFWRILYYKKHPEVPEIAHEYVIVTVK
jgi:DNA modification methylase